ncbi:MAG: hypothetical protein WD850_00775 [Candidatus Spechtbacterales bacterium]
MSDSDPGPEYLRKREPPRRTADWRGLHWEVATNIRHLVQVGPVLRERYPEMAYALVIRQQVVAVSNDLPALKRASGLAHNAVIGPLNEDVIVFLVAA